MYIYIYIYILYYGERYVEREIYVICMEIPYPLFQREIRYFKGVSLQKGFPFIWIMYYRIVRLRADAQQIQSERL